MKRKQDRRAWKSFFEALAPAEIRSPAGLILGKSFAIRMDTMRLLKTVNRIVRGLYYYVFETALPPNALVGSKPLGEYLKQRRDRPGATDFVQFVPDLPGRRIGNDTFEFRHFLLDEQSHRSFWYLAFYGRFGFVATTDNVPRTDANDNI
jgi:hypothetical protein